MWQNDVLRVLAVGELATGACKPAEKWFWCCLSGSVRKMEYTYGSSTRQEDRQLVKPCEMLRREGVLLRGRE